MNLISQRKMYRADGIFSEITTADGTVIMRTCEHAYPSGDPNYTWLPKIPAGTFECVRGMHRLHNMTEDFETFEVIGVPGHSGLLFHWGNWNEDSDGCILTGEDFAKADHHGEQHELVTNSRATFADFMAAQEGVDSFTLTVIP